MGMVFVNYQVKDNPLGAAGIHDVLARRFGADQVFRDCVSMAAGDHWARLEQAVALVYLRASSSGAASWRRPSSPIAH